MLKVNLQIMLSYSKSDIEKIFRRDGLASTFSRGVQILVADIVESKHIPEALKYYHPIIDARKTSVKVASEKAALLKKLFKTESGACYSVSMLINNMIELMLSGVSYDEIAKT